MKRCPKCGRLLPLSDFAKKVGNADGLQSRCRECCAEYAACWRSENTERKRAMDRAYAAEHAEQAREKTRAWAAANPERKKESDRRYTQENKERLRSKGASYRLKNWSALVEKKRAYRQANAERVNLKRRLSYAASRDGRAASNAARKALKIRACPPWADRFVIEWHYFYAVYLTKETGVLHQVDHVVPLRHPLVCGLHCEANLQAIPASENLAKGNKFFEVWP